MSGEAGPSTMPPEDIDQIVESINNLDDASIMDISSRLNPAARKRLLESLGSIPSPDPKGKRRALFRTTKPAKTLLEQYRLLRVLFYEHHINWIQDLRGHLLVNSEEKGNVSTCKNYKNAYKCWEEPADNQASTVMCLCPKRGAGPEYEKLKIRKPSKDSPKEAGSEDTEGYVYYQVPSWVKGTCKSKGIDVPFEKMVVHRLIVLAHLVLAKTPDDQVPTDMECSHLCGNPWCWLHLTMETASVNQARGPCFDPANEEKFACPGHATDPLIYCIRSRAASSLIPGLLVDGRDPREEVELSTARKWWNQKELPSGQNAVAFYNDLRKVGGSVSGTQKAAKLMLSAKNAILGSPMVAALMGRRNGNGAPSGES